MKLIENNVSNDMLTYIPSLDRFNNLEILNCSNNQITKLLPLPRKLKQLYCSNNQLTTLPAIPNTLLELSCANNQLTRLPTLPNTLIELNCSDNRLTTLPPLPFKLKNLYCFNNQLTTLPSLPNKLRKLICDRNKLNILPILPNTLLELNCANNQLTKLPQLPNTLEILICDNNQLTTLPALPNTLLEFSCSNNQLTTLPNLPDKLKKIICDNNQIYTLPSLPNNLKILSCSNNRLIVLPPIPDGLKILISNGNPLPIFDIEDWRSFYKPNPPIYNQTKKGIKEEKELEEEKLFKSYLAPSKLDIYYDIDFDKLSNDQIKMVISDWLPNQVIKIGPFYFYYLLKELYPQEFWKEMVKYFADVSDVIACRNKIDLSYIRRVIKKESNLIIVCNTFDPTLNKKYGIDLVNGIFVARYVEDKDTDVKFGENVLEKDDAYIGATCFREFGKLKIKLGLFMRCLGMSILKGLGKKNIYTEASNKYLLKYYHSLGFRSTGSKNITCSKENPYEEIYQDEKNIDNIIDKIYDKFTYNPYYYMRICNFDETKICFDSFDSLRKEIKNIDENILKIDYEEYLELLVDNGNMIELE
jgi:Leucine-rich repeat (LRR) protein